jgi:hypothetical protein
MARQAMTHGESALWLHMALHKIVFGAESLIRGFIRRAIVFRQGPARKIRCLLPAAITK